MTVAVGHAGGVEWSLAIVALALLGVAAISRRLSGTPVTPAMVFVAVGLLVGPEVLGEIDLESSSATVRTLAEATLALVLFCDASRIDLGQLRREVGVPVRLLGIGLPLTIALGAVAAAVDLRPADRRGGGDPRRSCWRRPTPRWGRRSSPSRASRRRIRQGLNVESGLNDGICVPLLFAAVAAADVESEISEGRSAATPPARGDRLRGRRRCGGRARGRGDRHLRRPPRPDRGSVAAGDPGRRRGACLRDRERARRIGLHRGVRRGHDLPAGARARPRATSTSSARRWATCSTASPSCSSAPSCSDPRSAT